MIASQSTFNFLSTNSDFYEIPFFQREYVWEQNNWSDLYEELLDEKSNHFLGSVIIRKNENNSKYKYSIIDGQQRLTTISILVRVCYDTILRYSEDVTDDDKMLLNSTMGTMIYHWSKDEHGKSVLKPVIKHSMVDEPNYSKVILHGLTKDEMDNITLDSEMEKQKNKKKVEKSKDSNILKCYKYFYRKIDGNLYVCNLLKELLCENTAEMIVKIDLDAEENEQAIFDTINTAGVRLSCADTIKNSIFQKAMENAATKELKAHIISQYNTTWGKTFSATNEDISYWNDEILVGRYKRNNIELLFQSIALIKGFYDPEKEPLSMIPICYKKYLAQMVKDARDNQQPPVNKILEFVSEIIEYAQIYRNCFFVPNDESTYLYEYSVERLFNILNSRKITALHPYILKLFKDENVGNSDEITESLEKKLKKIETYIVRSVVCGESTKNLNKECPILIRGDATIDDYIKEKNLNDQRFAEGLKNIRENELGKLLIFWIELYNQYAEDKTDKMAMQYSFTLEHIMPQNWDKNWGIKVLPVVDAESNEPILDEERAITIRADAVYELGNMALLQGSLNSSISDYEFTRKIDGDPNGKMKKKDGIRKFAMLTTTRDVVSTYDEKGVWNEFEIRERTKKFMKSIIDVWPVDIV